MVARVGDGCDPCADVSCGQHRHRGQQDDRGVEGQYSGRDGCHHEHDAQQSDRRTATPPGQYHPDPDENACACADLGDDEHRREKPDRRQHEPHLRQGGVPVDETQRDDEHSRRNGDNCGGDACDRYGGDDGHDHHDDRDHGAERAARLDHRSEPTLLTFPWSVACRRRPSRTRCSLSQVPPRRFRYRCRYR